MSPQQIRIHFYHLQSEGVKNDVQVIIRDKEYDLNQSLLNQNIYLIDLDCAQLQLINSEVIYHYKVIGQKANYYSNDIVLHFSGPYYNQEVVEIFDYPSYFSLEGQTRNTRAFKNITNMMNVFISNDTTIQTLLNMKRFLIASNQKNNVDLVFNRKASQRIRELLNNLQAYVEIELFLEYIHTLKQEDLELILEVSRYYKRFQENINDDQLNRIKDLFFKNQRSLDDNIQLLFNTNIITLEEAQKLISSERAFKQLSQNLGFYVSLLRKQGRSHYKRLFQEQIISILEKSQHFITIFVEIRDYFTYEQRKQIQGKRFQVLNTDELNELFFNIDRYSSCFELEKVEVREHILVLLKSYEKKGFTIKEQERIVDVCMTYFIDIADCFDILIEFFKYQMEQPSAYDTFQHLLLTKNPFIQLDRIFMTLLNSQSIPLQYLYPTFERYLNMISLQIDSQKSHFQKLEQESILNNSNLQDKILLLSEINLEQQLSTEDEVEEMKEKQNKNDKFLEYLKTIYITEEKFNQIKQTITEQFNQIIQNLPLKSLITLICNNEIKEDCLEELKLQIQTKIDNISTKEEIQNDIEFMRDYKSLSNMYKDMEVVQIIEYFNSLAKNRLDNLLLSNTPYLVFDSWFIYNFLQICYKDSLFYETLCDHLEQIHQNIKNKVISQEQLDQLISTKYIYLIFPYCKKDISNEIKQIYQQSVNLCDRVTDYKDFFAYFKLYFPEKYQKIEEFTPRVTNVADIIKFLESLKQLSTFVDFYLKLMNSKIIYYLHHKIESIQEEISREGLVQRTKFQYFENHIINVFNNLQKFCKTIFQVESAQKFESFKIIIREFLFIFENKFIKMRSLPEDRQQISNEPRNISHHHTIDIFHGSISMQDLKFYCTQNTQECSDNNDDFCMIKNEVLEVQSILQLGEIKLEVFKNKFASCERILFFAEITHIFEYVKTKTTNENNRNQDRELNDFLCETKHFNTQTPITELYKQKVRQDINELFQQKKRHLMKNLNKFMNSKDLIEKISDNQMKGISFYDMREFISDSQRDLSNYLILLHEFTPFFLDLVKVLEEAKNNYRQSTYQTILKLNECILDNILLYSYEQWDNIVNNLHKLGMIESNLTEKKTYISLLKHMYTDGTTMIKIPVRESPTILTILCNGQEYPEQKIREISSRVLVEKYSNNNQILNSHINSVNNRDQIIQQKETILQEQSNIESIQIHLELAYKITIVIQTLSDYGYFLFKQTEWRYDNNNESYSLSLMKMKEDLESFQLSLSQWKVKINETIAKYPEFSFISYSFYSELNCYFRGEIKYQDLNSSLKSLIEHQIKSKHYIDNYEEFYLAYKSAKSEDKLQLIAQFITKQEVHIIERDITTVNSNEEQISQRIISVDNRNKEADQFRSNNINDISRDTLELAASFITNKDNKDDIDHSRQDHTSISSRKESQSCPIFKCAFQERSTHENGIRLIRYKKVAYVIELFLQIETYGQKFLPYLYFSCDEITKPQDIHLFLRRYQHMIDSQPLYFYLIINKPINYNCIELLQQELKNLNSQNYLFLLIDHKVYKQEFKFLTKFKLSKDINKFELFRVDSKHLYESAVFFSSKEPGEGKTFTIEKEYEDYQKDKNSLIRFPINGDGKKSSLIDSIKTTQGRNNISKDKKNVYHIDLYDVNEFELDIILFEIIVLKSLTNYQDKYIQFGKDPLFLIEINNTIQNQLEKKLSLPNYFKKRIVEYNLDRFDVTTLSQTLGTEMLLCYKYMYGIEEQIQQEEQRKQVFFSYFQKDCQYFDEVQNIKFLQDLKEIDSNKFIFLLKQHFQSEITNKELSPNYWQIINFIKIFGTEMNKFERFADIFISDSTIKKLRTTIVQKSFDLSIKISISCLKSTFNRGNEQTLEEYLTNKTNNLIEFKSLQSDFVTFQEQENPSITSFFQKAESIPQCIKDLYNSQSKQKQELFAFDNEYNHRDYMSWLVMLCNKDSQNFYSFEKDKVRLRVRNENRSQDSREANEQDLNIKKIEEIKKIIIQRDNFFKIAIIFLRIRAKTPVILMGEAGIGKTVLIKLLSYILDAKFINKTIHAGVTENEIIELVETAQIESQQKKVIIFFDEVNTNQFVSGLFKEIIVDRNLKGRKINENIIPIAAINPYKLKSKEQQDLIKAQIHGGIKQDLADKFKGSKLEYFVYPLPESMYNFTWNYGGLNYKDEKLYIKLIMRETNKSLSKQNKFDKSFIDERLTQVVLESQYYLRKQMGERKSACSLRDVKRFSQLLLNIIDFLTICSGLERKLDIKKYELKFISVFLSFYINYYVRIPLAEKRQEYLQKLELLDIENYKSQQIEQMIRRIEKFFIGHIEIPSGIAKNQILKQNIFVQFICIVNKIPVCLVGPPGCSKTLSMRLLIQSMQGSHSKNRLFQQYPALMPSHYQGHINSTSERISELFENARKKQIDFNLQKSNNLSLVCIDEIGLAEISPNNPLKVLHQTLEQQDIAFSCISNWPLDASKMNRMLTIYRMEFEMDDIRDTFESILNDVIDNQPDAQKIRDSDEINDLTIQIQISQVFYNYMKELKEQKSQYEKFHGYRDFFCLVKCICQEQVQRIQQNGKQRDLNQERRYQRERGDKATFKQFIQKAFFKHLSGLENSYELLKKHLSLYLGECSQPYDPVSFIDENLFKDKNSRHLMIISENTEISSQYLKMKLQNSNYKFFIGSDFEEDKYLSESYRTVHCIINSIEEGHVVILQNIESIYQCFYEVFNQNYHNYNGRNYCKISLGAESSIIQVSDKFKLVLLINKSQLRRLNGPLINRFEKHFLEETLIFNQNESKQIKQVSDYFREKNKSFSLFKFKNVDKVIKSYFIQYVVEKKHQQNGLLELLNEEDIKLIKMRIIHLLNFSVLCSDFVPSDTSFNALKQHYINSGYHFSLNSFIKNKVNQVEVSNQLIQTNRQNEERPDENKDNINQLAIFTTSSLINPDFSSEFKVITLNSIQSDKHFNKQLQTFVDEQYLEFVKRNSQNQPQFQPQNQNEIPNGHEEIKLENKIIILADMSQSGSDSYQRVQFTMQKLEENMKQITQNAKMQHNISELKSNNFILMIIRVDNEFEMIPVSGKWKFYFIEELEPFCEFKEDTFNHTINVDLLQYIKSTLSLDNLINNIKETITNVFNFKKLAEFFILQDQDIFIQAYEQIQYTFEEKFNVQTYKLNRLRLLINQIFCQNSPFFETLTFLISQIVLKLMMKKFSNHISNLFGGNINKSNLFQSNLHSSLIQKLKDFHIKAISFLIHLLEKRNMVYSMANCEDIKHQQYIIESLPTKNQMKEFDFDLALSTLKATKDYHSISSQDIYIKLFFLQSKIKQANTNDEKLFDNMYTLANEYLKIYDIEITLFSDLLIEDLLADDSFQLNSSCLKIIKTILFIQQKEQESNNEPPKIYLQNFRGQTNYLIHIYLTWFIFEEQIRSISQLLECYQNFITIDVVKIFSINDFENITSPFQSLTEFKKQIILEFQNHIHPLSSKMQEEKLFSQKYPVFISQYQKFLHKNSNFQIEKYYHQISFYINLIQEFEDLLEDDEIRIEMEKIFDLDLIILNNAKSLFQKKFEQLHPTLQQSTEQKKSITKLFLSKWNRFVQQLLISSIKNKKLSTINTTLLSILMQLEENEKKINKKQVRQEFKIYVYRIFLKFRSMKTDDIFDLFNSPSNFNYRMEQFQEYYTLLAFGSFLQNNVFSFKVQPNINQRYLQEILIEQSIDKLNLIQKTIYIHLFREVVVQIVGSNSIELSVIQQQTNTTNQVNLDDSIGLDTSLQRYFAILQNEDLRLFIVKQIIFTSKKIVDFCNQSFYFRNSEWLKGYQKYSKEALMNQKQIYHDLNIIVQANIKDKKLSLPEFIKQIVSQYKNDSKNVFSSLIEGESNQTNYYPFCMDNLLQSEIDFYNINSGDEHKQLYKCDQCQVVFVNNPLKQQVFKLHETHNVNLIIQDLSQKDKLKQFMQPSNGICIRLIEDKSNKLSIKECQYQWVRLFSMVYHTIMIQNQSIVQIKNLLSIPDNEDSQNYLNNQVVFACNQFIHYCTQELKLTYEKSLIIIFEMIKYLINLDEVQLATKDQREDQNQKIQKLLNIRLAEVLEQNSQTVFSILELHHLNNEITSSEYQQCYPKSLRFTGNKLSNEESKDIIDKIINNTQLNIDLLKKYRDLPYLKVVSEALNHFQQFYDYSFFYLSYQFEYKDSLELTLEEAKNRILYSVTDKIKKEQINNFYSYYESYLIPAWNNNEQIKLKPEISAIRELDCKTKLINLVYSNKKEPTQFFTLFNALCSIQNELISDLVSYCQNYSNSIEHINHLYSEIRVWLLDQNTNKPRVSDLQNLHISHIIKCPSSDIFDSYITNGNEEGDGIQNEMITDLIGLQNKLIKETFYNTQKIDFEQSPQFNFLNSIQSLSETSRLIIVQLPENVKESLLYNKRLNSEQSHKLLLQMSSLYSLVGSEDEQLELSISTVMKYLKITCSFDELNELKVKHLYSLITFLEDMNNDYLVRLCSNKYKEYQNSSKIQRIIQNLTLKSDQNQIRLVIGRFIIRELSNENDHSDPNKIFKEALEKSSKIDLEDKQFIQKQEKLNELLISECYCLFISLSDSLREDSKFLGSPQMNNNENNRNSFDLIHSFTDRRYEININQLKYMKI